MRQVVLLKSCAKSQGGLEKYASRIAEAFRQRGDLVTVLTGEDGIRWPSFVRMERFDAFVRQWLERNEADVVFGMDRNREQTHIRAGNGVHAAYLKSRLFTEGRLKVLLCKLNPLHRKILELEKAGFENPKLKKLFVNSHMVKQEVLEHYDVDPAKIQVIHNGVEWEEMEADWQPGREERDEIELLFIGNGYLRKGLDRLLEGLSLMKQEPFHLSVVGKDKGIDRYRMKAAELGLQNRVSFFGPSREIRSFYQKADALIIPSFYDPFANVTVEALAMGLFVVSSKHNGGAEVLTEENGAVIEDLLSPDAMVAALKKAMQKKTEESARRIRQSVQHLDFSKQLQALMEGCDG